MFEGIDEGAWVEQIKFNDKTIGAMKALAVRLDALERRMPEDHIDRHLAEKHDCQHGTTCIEEGD